MRWLEEPELPRKEEIMAHEPPRLPHNEVEAPPGKKAQYLEVQYRLLRYEGTELLRRAVQEFREDPSMGESKTTAIYTNVVVHGYFVTRIGTLCRIGFCPSRTDKRIRWKSSPRLTPGTIVALSTTDDKFKSICLIANVVQKDLVGGLEPDLSAGEHKDTPPRINITWADPKDGVLDPEKELIMIEARNGYYESVRHTMRGLQEWSRYPSRFERYLIDGKPDVYAPRYMEDLKHTVDFTSIVTADTVTGSGPSPNLHQSINIKDNLPSSITGSIDLDFSQLNALRHVLTSELPIVQGPPGTGKTFTSISALKVLLSNINSSKHPIIIAAQTNHALDQILSLLTQATKTEFVRLGRRSQDERIASRTLFNLRKKSQKNCGGAELGRLEARRKTHIAAMKDLIGECFPGDFLKPSELLSSGLISQAQHDSLESEEDENPFVHWLKNAVQPCPPHRFTLVSTKWEEVEDPDAHEDRAITLDDDERDRISGKYIPILERWKGRVDSQMLRPALWKRTEAILGRYQDLCRVPREYRGAVYRYLRNQYIGIKTNDLRMLLEENAQLMKDSMACRARMDARVIQEFNIPVVGCTTTGLTKYRKLIEILEPRVMLIEEAAETREANITSALFPSLEQLILVGDHMQLAPHTHLVELSCHPYNLCISLFERMINLRMGHTVLSVQRRMVPEIRHILEPFYPNLRDHESVLDKVMRPSVPGMGDVSSYFFCHRWPESRTYQQSRVNETEARMIVGFVKYLVQNGTPASKITVLTFYRGQRRLIHEQLSRDTVLNNLNPLRKYNVCTVDGYQGEENDVIILSLVRSPDNDNPYNVGFLDNRNRVVVALSRARRGFYIFGNYRNLVGAGHNARNVWKPSLRVLTRRNRCHTRLPLVCKRHGNALEVRSPQDWEPLHGGCREKCAATLNCGHMCQMLCHPFSHIKVACRQPCNRELPCGHGCSELCSEQCRCGKKCNYVPEIPKRTNANFVPLDKFLGSEEETSDKALLDMVAEDVAPDLISIWGDDEIVPNRNGAVAQEDGGNVSPDCLNFPDSCETASEGNQHPSGTGSEATTHESESREASPVTASCSLGYSSEKSSLSGYGSRGSGSTSEDVDRVAQDWNTWDARADDLETKREAGNPNISRDNNLVVNETFQEVRVEHGCHREKVEVHRSKRVQPRQAEKTLEGAHTMDSPEAVGEPVKTPPSPLADDILIDLSVAPACFLVAPSRPETANGHCLEGEALAVGQKLEAQIEMVVPDEDEWSEVSDLIQF